MNEPELLDCTAAREQLSACCDGEAERTAALTAHLDGCASCRDYAAGCAELAHGFEVLRGAEPPADLEARLLARADAGSPRGRLLVVRGGAGWRVAAGLVGLLGVGAIGAWVESRRRAEPAPLGASWSEPLAGRALHPADASLRTWSEAMALVVKEERR